MATIKLEAGSEKNPHSCKERKLPVRNGRYLEFQDATEEELAFWNVLSDVEKRSIAAEAYKRCFFDALRDAIKYEADRAEKIQKENVSKEPPKAGMPPNSPPSPAGPGEPPILCGVDSKSPRWYLFEHLSIEKFEKWFGDMHRRGLLYESLPGKFSVIH
ncbi:MAG: hypothetical protein ACHQ1H_09120 [Nitrososphaerales archaeon]